MSQMGKWSVDFFKRSTIRFKLPRATRFSLWPTASCWLCGQFWNCNLIERQFVNEPSWRQALARFENENKQEKKCTGQTNANSSNWCGKCCTSVACWLARRWWQKCGPNERREGRGCAYVKNKLFARTRQLAHRNTEFRFDVWMQLNRPKYQSSAPAWVTSVLGRPLPRLSIAHPALRNTCV